MIFKKILTSIILVVSLPLINPLSAHQDFWTIKNFSNIKVKITTGYNYEEINKIELIGKLVEKLSKELNYSKQILIDFDHHYTSYCEPDYFIAYDRGQIFTNWNQFKNPKKILKSNGIVIRQVAKTFDFRTTLQLVEYAISNVTFIKKNQKRIDYKQNFNDWKLNSIDTNLIDLKLDEPISEIVEKVLATEVYIDETKHCKSLAYYQKDNEFIVYRKENKNESLLKTKNIYNVNCIEGSVALVFNTDSSFYFIDLINYQKPKFHTIRKGNESFKPMNINFVENSNKKQISIGMPYFSNLFSVIYDIESNSLIYMNDQK